MLRLLSRLFFLMSLTLSSAWAQGVHLVPSGPVVADGKQRTTLHIWIPQLLDTDKVKVKPATGKVHSIERLPNKMLAVQWAPAREGAPRALPISVNIRKRGAPPVTASLTVDLVPATEGAITVKATPGEWAPNQGDIQVKLTLTGTADQAVTDRRVLVTASAGSITEAVPLGDGTFSARWSPPADNTTARTIVISAVDAASPSSIYGWTSFPVLANQNLSFGATPDSQNILVIADREYGPVKASPAGTVAFDALVHPKVRQGTLRSTLRDGRTLDVPAPLPLTEYPRVSFMPQPRSIPAGGSHTILLVATNPAGGPLDNATITVRANASTLGQAKLTQTPGVYALTVAPDRAASTELQATMKDPAAMIGRHQKASSVLNVMPSLPTVSLAAEPHEFKEDTKQILLTATISAQVNAQAGPAPTFINTGSRILGRAVSKGGGKYQMKVRPMTDTVVAAVLPRVQGSAGTPAQLLIWPATSAVLPGESTPVMVAAADAFGHPVPDVEFKLSAPGGGTFSGDVKSGPNGIASATYTASDNPGLFTLNAKAAGLSMDTAIFHGDELAGPGLSQAGSAGTVALREALSAAVGTVRVDKQQPPPPPPVVVPPPVATAPAPAAPAPAPEPAAAAKVEAPAPEPAPKATAPQPTPPPKSSGATGGGFAGSTTEVYFALLGTHHRFTQEADVEEGELSQLPPTADFNRGMAPGFRIGGDYWLNSGSLAITTDARVTMEKVNAGGRVISYTAWSAQVGAKYKLQPMSFGQPYAIGTLQRAHNSLFKFRDATMLTMRATHQSLIGARVGGGLIMASTPDVSLDLSLSELFNPMPVMTQFGAVASKELQTDLSAMAGLEMFHKHVSMTSSGVDVDISALELSIIAGVKYTGL